MRNCCPPQSPFTSLQNRITMTAQTKIIILTSNEDIIRQFSHSESTNTHIIDMDNDRQQTSITTDDRNTINLNLLAELSKLNSTNDRVFKRALDSSPHTASKSAKISKKSTDLICVICGDRAIGYNYDAPSCAACKVFFRRNANQNVDKIRCFTGEGRCSVAHNIRRKCQKCRLERCFAAGMKKDLILTDQGKQQKKQRLEENRTLTSQRLSIPQSINASPSVSNLFQNRESLSTTSEEIDRLLMTMTAGNDNSLFDQNADPNQMDDILLETLPVEDWITVESIRSSFLSIFQDDVTRYPIPDASDRTSALINWSYIAHQINLNFITFFRQIPEFEDFDINDRFVLIKYNLFPLFPILKAFYHNRVCYFDPNEEELAKQQRFYTLCFGSGAIRETFWSLTNSLVQLTEQDPAIVSLLLGILMFSQGLSINEDEPPLNDPLRVNQAQSYYTRVLWNYMNNKWDEMETCRRFSRLLAIIFRMQLSVKKFRNYWRTQFPTSDAVDKLAPLMQSVLNIA